MRTHASNVCTLILHILATSQRVNTGGQLSLACSPEQIALVTSVCLKDNEPRDIEAHRGIRIVQLLNSHRSLTKRKQVAVRRRARQAVVNPNRHSGPQTPTGATNFLTDKKTGGCVN